MLPDQVGGGAEGDGGQVGDGPVEEHGGGDLAGGAGAGAGGHGADQAEFGAAEAAGGAAAVAAMGSACRQVIASRLACTLRYDANRGSANTNMATISATETTVRRILRGDRGGFRPVAARVRSIIFTVRPGGHLGLGATGAATPGLAGAGSVSRYAECRRCPI